MLTRRQKNSIRGITAALTCSAMLAGFLIYTNISNTEKTVPVVFSDILEGAVAYSDESDIPAVTLNSEELMETMFSEQYAAFFDPDDPAYSVTFISPVDTVTANNESQGHEDVTYLTESGPSIPENPNELTLLSEELNSLQSSETVGNSDTDTTSPASVTTEHTLPAVTSPTTEETPYFLNSSRTTTEISTVKTTVPTTSPTTARTTVSTTKATTTTVKTTTAAKTTTTAAHESKAPFTNVGGGVFYTSDDVYLTMFRLVNNVRREAGLKELWYSARVHEVCELRTSELSSYYSHTRPDGSRFSTAFKDIGITYDKCGENIAYGRNMFDTPEEVFRAWMDSPSHKENILSPDFECCAFGLSILKVGNDTYYYWAQEFAKL